MSPTAETALSTTTATPVTANPAAPRMLSGPRKAAILMLTVGDEESTTMLRGMSERDVQRLTDEISRMTTITPEEQTEVLFEFYGLQQTQQFMLHGGPEYASRLLIEAFGRQRADEFMREISQLRSGPQGDLLALGKMDPAQLSKFSMASIPKRSPWCWRT